MQYCENNMALITTNKYDKCLITYIHIYIYATSYIIIDI